MKNDKITIEIPVFYLLQIAVYGNMGTGELPDLMKIYAQRILRGNGYSDILREEQDKSLKQLRNNLKNVLGNEGMSKIDSALQDAVVGLKFATELNKGIKN